MTVVHMCARASSLKYLLLNQLAFLRASGYGVATVSSPGPEVGVVEANGIKHLPVPISRRITPFRDLVSLWKLFITLRRIRPTIAHTHTAKVGLLGQIAARLAGVPIVVNTVHGFYLRDGMPAIARKCYLLLERLAAMCSDSILSQNYEDIETAVREGICSREKIRRLGNGIDIGRFAGERLSQDLISQTRRELGLRDEDKVIGFVGRLVVEKGILELLEAVRRVRCSLPDVRLLIVGPIDHEKRDAVTATVARKLGIEEICVFTGIRQDMPVLYALMDVFVLPSHREGFPRSPMEASAMGVPCIVSDIRGCRETVQHNRNGLLVPRGDVKAIAGAVNAILANPEMAARMSDEGRLMALTEFDERAVFERVIAEYARLLRLKGLPVPSPRINSSATQQGEGKTGEMCAVRA